MTDLKILKAGLERQIAEAQRKLQAVEEVMQMQSDPAIRLRLQERPNPSSIDPKQILNSEEIEKSILMIDGDFMAREVPQAIIKLFGPDRFYDEDSIPNLLHKLVNDKKLEYARERVGRTPAIYRRVPLTKHQ